MTNNSHLLAIPKELGLNIYDFLYQKPLLREIRLDHPQVTQPQNETYETQLGHRVHHVPALAKTCKFLYHEVKPILDAVTETRIVISRYDTLTPQKEAWKSAVAIKESGLLKSLQKARVLLELGKSTSISSLEYHHTENVVRRIEGLTQALDRNQMLEVTDVVPLCGHDRDVSCQCFESYWSRPVVEALLKADFRTKQGKNWYGGRKKDGNKLALSEEIYEALLEKISRIDARFPKGAKVGRTQRALYGPGSDLGTGMQRGSIWKLDFTR